MSPVPFGKPRLFLSRCVEFAACRWDGQIISNDAVHALKDHVEFIPICPETEINLTTPRDPLRVIVIRKQKTLLQIKDRKDLTPLIKDFAVKFLETHQDLDGFILKSKSPSCGAYSTTIYKSADSTDPIAIGSGLFAEMVQKISPLLPIIEESDLNDDDLRDFFLTRIFTIAAYRAVERTQSLELLRQFLEKNDTLFNWFNPALLSSMKSHLNQTPNSDSALLFSNVRILLLQLLQQRPLGKGCGQDFLAYPEGLRSLSRSF